MYHELPISLHADATLVIRLKQIEHIRNERNTLAAVAGHPFITTMITSFSDKDSLYMIVRALTLPPVTPLTTQARLLPWRRGLHVFEETEEIRAGNRPFLCGRDRSHSGIPPRREGNCVQGYEAREHSSRR